MPRTPPRLFRQAAKHSPHAATLLLACKSLPLALNELRWIREHVILTAKPAQREQRLLALCRQRGRGIPLQYVLKSQPFGPLEIKCRPGVLIPRPETEAYTYHLAGMAKRLAHSRGLQELKVLDFCAGTGCIPLLLFSLLQHSFSTLQVQGVDVSTEAVHLAQENLVANASLGHLNIAPGQKQVKITQGDIFSDSEMKSVFSQSWDILTSNPPYISLDVWHSGRGQLGHSVRKFEPALALVPGAHLEPPPGWQSSDVFYARLLDIAYRIKPKLLLLEIGDEPQALRVARNYLTHPLASVSTIEIWRDTPDVQSSSYCQEIGVVSHQGQNHPIPIKGSGNARSIMIKSVGAPQPSEER
ncbi:Modification methylase HemK [Cordyceps javanica]|uniref:peptide chain release factor N(5)-glutamine methyltransferase n=1 Tax=Cordyceps javanica TaxID=43265 RepID=A0A545UUD2_9HYPO|nr:Modification methylase HemK [Cordyceps javanica]TQW04984.1 Modification methylase HemK [Cordyceps javanica]